MRSGERQFLHMSGGTLCRQRAGRGVLKKEEKWPRSTRDMKNMKGAIIMSSPFSYFPFWSILPFTFYPKRSHLSIVLSLPWFHPKLLFAVFLLFFPFFWPPKNVKVGAQQINPLNFWVIIWAGLATGWMFIKWIICANSCKPLSARYASHYALETWNPVKEAFNKRIKSNVT